MRTNIVIDDKLMKDALLATGAKTKREAVELGLRVLLRLRQQEEIRRFRGKFNWQTQGVNKPEIKPSIAVITPIITVSICRGTSTFFA